MTNKELAEKVEALRERLDHVQIARGPIALAGNRAELGANLASAVATGGNRAAEQPADAHLKDLMRSACEFATNGDHEEARVCLDIAIFIDKRWL